MPNLPEDIVDRIKSLERQVRQLTAYVHTRAAAPARTPAEAQDSARDGSGGEDEEDEEGTGGKPA
ncbi:hypothetical protein GCM10018785_14860 [Streptomyces longispororuber]|uniref:Uncharacterized protein n=1 Tax=Streptomyces longispororuber TaxID=68230 RepID=A0A918ZCZ7_9ACTN|nr:hypothetical protein [Streptomyces longispororuber]GHE46152.1 hypothetical protein GCM10018785_14860 [Streptomyces longispororuber]